MILSGRVFERSMTEMRIDVEAFFDFAQKAGFDGVELRYSQINPESSSGEIDHVVSLSDETGLWVEMMKARGVSLDSPADLKGFKRYLDLAGAIRCRQIQVGGEDASSIREAASLAEERGVKVGANNHIGSPLETIHGTFEFLETIDHPNYYLFLDPSHLWLNKEIADAGFIEKIASRCSYLIVQDYVEDQAASRLGVRNARFSNPCDGDVGYWDVLRNLSRFRNDIPVALVQPGSINDLGDAKMWSWEIKNGVFRGLSK